MKLISVIMPVYNAEEFIEEAIESILYQSFGDFEFIIVNDGSTDESDRIIRKYADMDSRIQYIVKENGGVAAALNEGLEKANGKYVARMDADDVSYPERFEVMYEYMETHTDIDICGSWALENGKKPLKKPIDDADIRLSMVIYSPFIHPTVFFRRDFLEKNNIRYSYTCAEDYDLWIRCSQIAYFGNVDKYLYMYRVHKNNVSGKNNADKFMFDDLRIKNEYSRIYGSELLIRKHFLDVNFDWDDFVPYIGLLKTIMDSTGVVFLPKRTCREISIILIRCSRNIKVSIVRYVDLMKMLSLPLRLRDVIYIFGKYIQLLIKCSM